MGEDEGEADPEDQIVKDENDKNEIWVRMKMRLSLSLRISMWRMRMMRMICG